MAFKCGRVIRQRLSYLEALVSTDDKAKDLERGCPWKDDFAQLREMVSSRKEYFQGVDVRGIVREGATAARNYFLKNSEAWRTNPVFVALGVMDHKGGAATAAKELLTLALQGQKGIAQAMLAHLPDTAERSEIEAAITCATQGIGLWFQDDALETYRRLAKLTGKAKLAYVLGGQELHDIIWDTACYWMVGNFFSETVVKTLEHGLHGTQRRTMACATRLSASRHRAHVYPITDDDFKAAAAANGHNKASRVTEKEGIEEELAAVELRELLQLELEGEEDEEFEEEFEDDEEGGRDKEDDDDDAGEAEGGESAAATRTEGRAPGWPTDLRVTVATIRKALAVGDIVECLWEMTAGGQAKIYLALVVEVKQRIIRIRWLAEREDQDDLFVPCRLFSEIESWEMRKIWDTCSDVTREAPWKADLVWRQLYKGQPKRQIVADLDAEAGWSVAVATTGHWRRQGIGWRRSC